MTPEEARSIFLTHEGAEEGQHHGHLDFRVGGKIFATLQSEKGGAALRLPMTMGESIPAEHSWTKLVSKFGGMAWIAIDLESADPKALSEWSEVAHAQRGAAKPALNNPGVA